MKYGTSKCSLYSLPFCKETERKQIRSEGKRRINDFEMNLVSVTLPASAKRSLTQNQEDVS